MQVSDVIDSKYRVDTPLSLRGYRSRFVGTDLETNHRVIIETLHDTVVKNPQAIEGIRYEIEMSQRLNSPYFMRIKDTVKSDNRIYLIWQYVDATPLTHNQAFKSLTQRDILRFIGLSVKALEFAHHSGYIHGALSTDNLLITSSMTPIVIGFAVPGQPMETDPGLHGGISAYRACAPELFEGAHIDESCDFYSLGVIGLYLLGLHEEYQQTKQRHPSQASRVFYEPQSQDAIKLVRGMCSRDRAVRMKCAQAISDTSFFDSMATPAHGTEVLKLSKKEIRQIKKFDQRRNKIYLDIDAKKQIFFKAIGLSLLGISAIVVLAIIFGL